ncbi:MAG: hypothetical protein JWM09_792 [Francisellaceae bacterium]|nr:hypothetical protein [Francisellaceae bacterium]
MENEKLTNMQGKFREDNLKSSTTAPLGQLIYILSNRLSFTPSFCIVLISILLGAMLDFCSFVLLISIENQPKLIFNKMHNFRHNKIRNKKNIKSHKIEGKIIENKNSIGLISEYQKIKEFLISRSHPPSLRHIKKVTGIGTQKVYQYFKELENEGIIRKTNNRYMLC